jgi:hypothetical protein
MGNLTKYAEFTIEDAEAAEEELKKLASGSFLKWATGKNVVRFLPALVGAKPFVVIQQHFVDLPGGGAVSFPCPRRHANRRCPVCERADKMRASSNPIDNERADKLMPKLRAFMNCVDRKNPELGVQVAAFGKQIYEPLLAIRKNEEAGGNFLDPGPEGFDIIIEKKGEGMRTEYSVLVARRPSPLGNEEWLEQMHDLTRYARVPSDEEIARMLSGGGRGGGGGGGGGRGRNANDDTIDTE